MGLYYEDDAVKLYHGDCRDILPTLEAVDHVITDPPYSERVHSKTMRSSPGSPGAWTAGISQRRELGFDAITPELIEWLAEVACEKTRRWTLVFCDVESAHLFGRAISDRGGEWVRTGAWVKPGATPQFTGDRPAPGYEAIVIAHPAGKKRWNGGGRQGVWEHPPVRIGSEAGIHPSKKPDALMAQLVTDFTDAGDLILDPFAGSGTTAVAAKRHGRRCILIEREEKYCEVAARRLSMRFDGIGLFAEPA